MNARSTTMLRLRRAYPQGRVVEIRVEHATREQLHIERRKEIMSDRVRAHILSLSQPLDPSCHTRGAGGHAPRRNAQRGNSPDGWRARELAANTSKSMPATLRPAGERRPDRHRWQTGRALPRSGDTSLDGDDQHTCDCKLQPDQPAGKSSTAESPASCAQRVRRAQADRSNAGYSPARMLTPPMTAARRVQKLHMRSRTGVRSML